jgi:predicted RNA-binding protein with EMAP domain
LQWLQDPSEINGDNLKIIRRKASRYFRNKKREKLKERINELATNSKNKNIRYMYRGINELVPGPNLLEVEIAIAKLEKYKSPGSDQIPSELIQAGGEMLLSTIHKLINSIWNKK